MVVETDETDEHLLAALALAGVEDDAELGRRLVAQLVIPDHVEDTVELEGGQRMLHHLLWVDHRLALG